MIKRGLIILSALICFLGFLPANAQLQGGDVALRINPEYPIANSSVTASVSTYTIDLDTVKISWFLNGNLSLEGIGKKTFSFTVGNFNSKTTLEVKIETTGGSIINKQVVITPNDIDMLWEAYDSYVPPFYKGKKLGPSEGTFKVVALPSTKNQLGLNYKWELDDVIKQSSSGYEKNSYIFKKSYLDSNNTVNVLVSDLLGKNIGSGSTIIKNNDPKIIFYEKSPFLGTKWQTALFDNLTINQDGISIVAEPYFFSQKMDSQNLKIAWLLNNEPIESSSQKNLLSIKPETGKSGNSSIKVIINNAQTLFQSLEKQLNVNF